MDFSRTSVYGLQAAEQDAARAVKTDSLPTVSVIIPIYNGEADLPELLACLQAQTYPAGRVDYVLVDNGSRDRTPELLQSYQEQSAASVEETAPLRALSEPHIQSSYAARNCGIRNTAGEVLAFTDADCRPQPQWLAELMAPFVEAQVGMVAGEILALPGSTRLERYADRRETLSQKHTLAHPFYPYGQTANLAIRRSVFQQIGLFRPNLTTGGDADICWRMQQQTDCTLAFAPTAIVRHRHRATLAELRSQWRRYGRSNRYLHDLHGVSLAKEMTPRDALYRWSRWLLKEVPLAIARDIRSAQEVELLDVLFDTPLDLLCGYARQTGQRHAQLPPDAREIEWLHSTRERTAR